MPLKGLEILAKVFQRLLKGILKAFKRLDMPLVDI